MKHHLLIPLILLSTIVSSQTVTFKCLEAEMFPKGCPTCDNSRTGKMITGIELTMTGIKTEFINPIIVKYDSLNQVTFTDYRFVTKTFKLSNTGYSDMASLLRAAGQCMSPDPRIDTIQYANDTLGISFLNDSVSMYKVKIPTGDKQKFDTISYSGDTLYLSLQNDGEAVHKLVITGGGGSDSQTLTWSSGTGNLTISNGNTVNLDGRYLTTEVDGSTTNELQSLMFFNEQPSEVVPMEISGSNTVYFDGGAGIDLTKVSSTQLEIKALDPDSTNEIQYIDTISYASDTLKISLYKDGVAQSKIYIPSGGTGSDDQMIDTFDIVSNQLRLSIQNDGQNYKSVDLSPYLDNTDSQGFDSFYLAGTQIRASIENDGDPTKVIDLSSIPVSHDIVTNGNVITQTINGTQDTTLAVRTNSLNLSGNIITGSVNGVQDTTLVIGSVSNTSSVNNLSTTVNGVTGANVTIINSNTASLSGNTITSNVNGVSDTVLVIGQNNISISSNNLTSTVNGVQSTVSLASYLDNTDSQTLSWNSGNGNLSISGGNTVNLDGRYLTSEVDGSTTNEIQSLSITGGKGTINLSLGGGSVTLNDSSATNEIQTIDTFDIASNILRLSISSDGQNYKSVNLTPYLDNTDDQALSFGAKSGSTNYLNIQNSVGVQINDGTGISISRDASNVITVNNTGDLSTTNEIQTVDTFDLSGNTLRLSLSSDGQAFNSVNLSGYLDNTDSQNITFGTKSGSDVPLNISGGTGVTLTEGSNTTITRNSATQITISSAGLGDGDKGDIDVSGSGTVWTIDTDAVNSLKILDGTIATVDVANDAITYGKLQNVTANSVLANTAGVVGDVQEIILGLNQLVGRGSSGNASAITLGTGLSMSSAQLNVADQSATNELQTIDTFDISSNTVRLSLSSDGQVYKSIDLSPYLDNTDAQTLTWTTASGDLQISGGNTVNLDGRYLRTEVDGSTTNEIQYIDTFRVSGGNLEISLSQDGAARSQLAVTQIAPVQSVVAGTGISVSGTNTITVTNTGDLSATNEGSLTVGAGTGTTSLIQSNTSGSTAVTLSASGIITLSENTGTGTITIDAAEVDGSTSNELQSLSYGTKSGSDIPLNISSGTGVTITEGAGVTITRNASNQITIAATGLTDGDKGDIDVTSSGSVWSLDTNSVMTIDVQDNAITNAKLADMANSTFKGRTTAGTGDPEDLTVAQAKTLLNLSGTNTGDQTITLTGDVTGSGTGSFATTISNDVVTYAKLQNVTGNAVLANTAATSGDVQEIILSASQLVGRGSSGNASAITLGTGLSMSGAQLNVSDQSATNELQTLSTATNTVTLSNGGGSFTITGAGINTASTAGSTITITGTEVDGSVTNEIQTIDTFDISSNVIRLSLSSDGQNYKSVDLSPYLDNTDAQSLSYGAKSGSTNFLNITSGTGVQINDGTGISISRDASNVITVNNTGDLSTSNEIQTIDTFRVSGGNLELSLSSDGVARSQLAVTQIAPVQSIAAGTGISVSGTNTITVTNTGDLSTSNEGSLTVGAGTSTTSLIQSNTSGSTAVTLTAGTNITLSENTGSGIITIDATEVDGSTTNELQTYSHSGTTSYTNTLSNGGGSFTINAGGINSISHSSGTLTITATEVDGSTSNELQSISYGTKSGADIPLNITSGTGVTLTEGSGITITRNASNQITFSASGLSDGDKGDIDVTSSGTVWTIDTSSVTSLKILDGTIATADIADDAVTYAKLQNVSANAVLANTAGSAGNVQEILLSASQLVGRGSSGNASAITLGTGLSMTGAQLNVADQSATNEIQTIDTFDISSNTLRLSLSSDGQNYKSVSLAAYLDNTDGQTLTWTSGTGNLQISGGNTVNLDGRYLTSEVDGSTSNELQTYSHSGTTSYTNTLSNGGGSFVLQAAGINSISHSSGTVTITATEVDGSTSNELQTYSHSGTTSYTNTLSNGGGSFTINAGGINTISHSAGTLTITATEVDGSTSNELQSISYGTKSGSDIPLNITSGTGVTITEGSGITITRNASNQITFSATGLSDGDKGDIDVSGSGTVWSLDTNAVMTIDIQDNAVTTAKINALAVTNAKINDVAWSKVTGTPTTLSGYGITDALSNSTSSTQDGYFGDIYLKDDTSPSHYLQITDAENLTAARTLSINTGDASRTLTFTGNATISGTNTGDQTITLTSDVTGSGTGSFATTIAANAVTDAKFRQSAGLSVVGRSTNTTGNVADITAANDGEVLRRSGTAVGFGTIATAGIANDAVTYAKIQNVAANSFLGNNTASSGDVAEVTLAASQLAGRGSTGNLAAISLGGILSMSGTTLSATEVDGSTSNELQTYSHSGTTSYTNTLSNSGGSFTINAAGINTISHSAGTVTITATEVDGSTSNELQSLSYGSKSGSTNFLNITSGTGVQINDGTGISISRDASNVITVNNTGDVSQKDTAYFFPETYGAVVNDATDDRAAIQSAIDAACARGGGIVWLRKGEYRITTSASRGTYNSGIHLCSNVYLMGTGYGSVIYSKLTSSGQHVVSLPHSGTNVVIKDIQIKADSVDSGAAIFGYFGMTNLEIEHVKIDRGMCWGVLIKEASKGVIQNCDIQNGGQCHCVEINNCNNFIVKNNWLYSNGTKTYFPTRGNGCESFYNRNGENRPYANLIEGNTIWGTGGGIVVWADSITKVYNNTIRTVQGHGMTIKKNNDASPTYPCVNIQVKGNTIFGTGYANNSSLGMLVDDENREILIEGNSLDTILSQNSGSGGGVGMDIQAPGTVINNNIIRHCSINGMSLSGSADYCSITGNVIMDCSMLQNGFRAISCSGDRCVITGNSAHDTRGTHKMDICIYVPGTNNVIVGNNASGANSGDAIYCPGTGNVEANNKEN